jgi:integrase
VFQRADGLWVGVVDISDGGGRRRRVQVTARDKDAMLAKLTAAQARHRAGLPPVDPTLTTGSWLEWWAENILPARIQDNTRTNYIKAARNWVVPHIGKVPLVKLRPEHVQRMMQALEAQGLAPDSRIYARMVLRRALRDAERWDKVTRNAAALVDPPRKAGTRLDDALDAVDAEKVLTTARGDRLEALAVLVLATGMRQGETLRLRWADVNLDRATVRVTKSKTEAGIRTIALPAFVVAALREHHRRQAAEQLAARVWADPTLVFTTTIGTALDARNVRTWWYQLTINAGVGRRRFHASRHTAATLMLNNGVALEVVSATLGHAGLAITADVYAKVRPELQRTAATAMDSLFGTGGAS